MSLIEQICGNYPEGFKKLDISSDPNYVFVNDPSYSARQLFDIDGNKVFVNSFIECEHYVSGGWGFSPLKNQELFFQDVFLYFIIFGVIVSFLNQKLKSIFKSDF